MSTFSKCLGVLGLSIPEAAKYLELSEGVVERLCTFSLQVEEDTWFKLADLYGEVLLGASIAEGSFREHGLPDDAFDDYDMGHAGMPAGAGEAAGAMAVLNHLHSIRIAEKDEARDRKK